MTLHDTRLDALREIERKLLWLACWMIHHANHIRPKGEVKVGGHQASSASMVSLMTALYFGVLRPEDRVAVKPHAAPVFHAIQYLAGLQTREKLQNFRGLGGAQAYPSRTKDTDDVDFSTGSVGLGVAVTAFASLVQDYVRARPWAVPGPEGRMVALVGDAELDEGNIYECLQEGWKHGLRNCWWVVDYNRQSLDGVVREGLHDRLVRIFEAFGWEVRSLKHGALQRAAFAEPGGEALRLWIDRCPNALYSALTYQGGAAWRKRLMDEIGDQGPVSALLARRSDADLARLMETLGGHCLPTLVEAFSSVNHDRPVLWLAYTIKGWGTPLAGHKDNHAGLMTPAQMAAFRDRMGVREGHEWEPFEGLALPEDALRDVIARTPFLAAGARRLTAPPVPAPGPVALAETETSTQSAFGRILEEIARAGGPLADRILTTSPDVTVSTNLGPWVNRRGLFARETRPDTFRDERVPSAQKWRFSREGQHVELGIAEMNLFLLLAAAGLSHSLFGARLIPIGTVYDPFIARGLDALTYACYQDSRFIIAGTPSGVSLSHEGGAHQSVGTPLIGMSQDGLAAFEPAFADELAVIMDWAFAYLQRRGKAEAVVEDREARWLREETGGSVYLRLSTRPLEQPRRSIGPALAQAVVDGGYWLRPPGPNAELALVYQGVVASEAIAAAGRLGQMRRDVGVLAVTSADRLNAGWTGAQRARARGEAAEAQVERLLAPLPRHCTLLTLVDGHPATLAWMGGVFGHPVIARGVEHFGQTGTVAELYRHFGIDAQSLVDAALALTPGRPG
jgi:pyruvate dehydrogenase E1 component